jgi:uncharacterized protein (DUF983 family)
MIAVEPSVPRAALWGRCPRCGLGKLFKGYLALGPSCRQCNPDYSIFDVGDGAAEFAILIVGAIVTGGALLVEVTYQPPYWVHPVIWTPLISILTLTFLRITKSFLPVLQYKRRAGEAKRVDQGL